MPITNINEWSTTAANNTELNGISIANNTMLVSNIDNVIRELMAQLATVEDGAQVNVGTDLSVAVGNTQITLVSSTGANVVIPPANTDDAGLLTAALWSKLAALNSNAATLAQLNYLAEDGSTSAPAFRFTDATNTGLYRISDGRVGVVIAGVLHAVIDTVDGGSSSKGLLTRDGAISRFMREETLDDLIDSGSGTSAGTMFTITMPAAGYISAEVTVHTAALNGTNIDVGLTIDGVEVNSRSFEGNAGNAGSPLSITCYGHRAVSSGSRVVAVTVTGTSVVNWNGKAQGFCNG